MRIVKLVTIRNATLPNVLWVQLHTEDGMVGLGETYYLPGAVEAVIHDLIAAFVLDRSAGEIESIWDQIFSYCNFFGYAGAEMRALSAIDIALWDLLGQKCGLPIYNLLGGPVRDSIPVYNTCVDTELHSDADAFLNRPAQLARELLSEGIRAMKIWPWDRFAPRLKSTAVVGPAGYSAMGPSGSYISALDLDKGLNGSLNHQP